MGSNVTAIGGPNRVQQTVLALEHRRQAVLIGVIPAKQVQQPVTGQPLQFLLQAVLVLLGLAPSRVQGDHDVAQLDRAALQPVRGVLQCCKGEHIRGFLR